MLTNYNFLTLRGCPNGWVLWLYPSSHIFESLGPQEVFQFINNWVNGNSLELFIGENLIHLGTLINRWTFGWLVGCKLMEIRWQLYKIFYFIYELRFSRVLIWSSLMTLVLTSFLIKRLLYQRSTISTGKWANNLKTSWGQVGLLIYFEVGFIVNSVK